MLPPQQKWLILIGIIMCLLSVIAGSFGAHLVKKRIGHEGFAAYTVATRYQMYHALAMFLAAWLSIYTKGSIAIIAGWIFFVGMMIFSGSLYLVSLTGKRGFGAATPVGGMILIFGWILLATSIVQIL